jgi:hypothetical protein
MFSKIIEMWGTVRKAKSVVDHVSLLIDRADDDGVTGKADGKADALNLLDDLKLWELECVNLFKQQYVKLLALLDKGMTLAKHIKDGD